MGGGGKRRRHFNNSSPHGRSSYSRWDLQIICMAAGSQTAFDNDLDTFQIKIQLTPTLSYSHLCHHWSNLDERVFPSRRNYLAKRTLNLWQCSEEISVGLKHLNGLRSTARWTTQRPNTSGAEWGPKETHWPWTPRSAGQPRRAAHAHGTELPLQPWSAICAPETKLLMWQLLVKLSELVKKAL